MTSGGQSWSARENNARDIRTRRDTPRASPPEPTRHSHVLWTTKIHYQLSSFERIPQSDLEPGIHNQLRGDFAAPNVYSKSLVDNRGCAAETRRARLARAFSLSHQVTLTPPNGGGKRAQRYQYTSKSEASETHPLGRGDTPGFFPFFFSNTTGRDFAKRLYQKELQ